MPVRPAIHTNTGIQQALNECLRSGWVPQVTSCRGPCCGTGTPCPHKLTDSGGETGLGWGRGLQGVSPSQQPLWCSQLALVQFLACIFTLHVPGSRLIPGSQDPTVRSLLPMQLSSCLILVPSCHRLLDPGMVVWRRQEKGCTAFRALWRDSNKSVFLYLGWWGRCRDVPSRVCKFSPGIFKWRVFVSMTVWQNLIFVYSRG